MRRPQDPQRPQEPPDGPAGRARPHLGAGGPQSHGQPHPEPAGLLHEASQGQDG